MKSSIKYLLFIFTTSLILFWPSLATFFTNDDFFLLKISQIESLGGFLNFFNLTQGPDGLGMYRPLTTQVFYFLGWKLFDLNPLGLHVISFLVFFLVIYLVYKLAVILTKKESVGLGSAFLYATSATHFGHLYYLATFQELGLALFFLFSTFFFIKFLERGKSKYYIFSIVGFILALLSKETAVVFPVVALLLYAFYKYRGNTHLSFKKLMASLVLYIAILVIYFYFRFYHYGFATGDSYVWDFSTRVVNTLFWYGLWSFNLPEMLVDFVGPGINLNPNLLRFWSKEVLPIFSLFLVQALIIFYTLFRSKIFTLKVSKKDNGIIFFSLCWFVVTLLPVLFLPLHKFTFYLTLPLVGFVILISHLFLKNGNTPLTSSFFITWVIISFLTLSLTIKTHWITKGAETSRRVHVYLVDNKEVLDNFKTIAFYDSWEDGDLPWSPAETLKVVLSEQNYFKVFWKGEITASYYNSEGEAKGDIKLKARQFLGY